MMIHSVYFWLTEGLSEADCKSLEEGMRALFEIDVVADGKIGKPAKTPERDVTQNTFDYALFLHFDSVEKHDAYQVLPKHDEFVISFAKWFRSVQVYDTEIL